MRKVFDIDGCILPPGADLYRWGQAARIIGQEKGTTSQNTDKALMVEDCHRSFYNGIPSIFD